MSAPLSTPALHGHPAPPMAGGLPISEAVADAAAGWLTLLMSGEATDAERQQWQQWRTAHPDHERAWAHVEAVTHALRRLEPRAGYQALSAYASTHAAASTRDAEVPVGPAAQQRAGRRKAITLLLWGGVAGSAGLAALRTQAWRPLVADHRTGTGERRGITLDDGTHIALNTASAVDVRYDAGSRLLRLVAGEVLVTTAQARGRPADPRPLWVQTDEGRVRALGTRFSVRQHAGRTDVAVLDSAVELQPAEGAAPRVLHAGERASFTRHAVDATQPLDPHASAWARGQIVAEDTPLGDFIAELGRHRPGLLRCDPAVAGLRLSGVFPLDDTTRILETLPSVLPVQVRLRTRWWVVVEAAAP